MSRENLMAWEVKLKSLLLFLTSIALSSSVNAELITLTFPGWEIQYNCQKRGPESFFYQAVPDTGNHKRSSRFHAEERLPRHCRQFSTSTYKLSKNAEIFYDRGHMVPANHFDHDKAMINATNSMANIVPQASKLNRHGAWRKTEELVECYRDIGITNVWGGVIWGKDFRNDHFFETHGVVTPDFLWKIIQFPNGKVNGWIMPNSNAATAVNMDSYLVAPKTISKYTGIKFPFFNNELNKKDDFSMKKPKGCSREHL